jgi:hypothetical protein
MSRTFTVATTPIKVDIPPEGATVANGGSGTAYHSTRPDPTTVLNDGSIASGAGATFDASQWFVSDTSCTLTVDAAEPGDVTTAELTAAIATAVQTVTKNTQTNSYTLVAADAGKVVELNKGSGVTLTIPTNATVAFAIGTRLEIHQVGAGQITVAGAGGVTVNSPGGKLKVTGQFSSAYLRKRATDEWELTGDIAA